MRTTALRADPVRPSDSAIAPPDPGNPQSAPRLAVPQVRIANPAVGFVKDTRVDLSAWATSTLKTRPRESDQPPIRSPFQRRRSDVGANKCLEYDRS